MCDVNRFSPYKSLGPDGMQPIISPSGLYHYTQSGYESVKDFRPIVCSSFVLKTLERILDEHIKSRVATNGLSNGEHVYERKVYGDSATGRVSISGYTPGWGDIITTMTSGYADYVVVMVMVYHYSGGYMYLEHLLWCRYKLG